MGELSLKFICVNLILLFVCAKGNVMMNYELSNSNHIPVAATYSGMRDRGYSRHYQYPPPDDLPSASNNNWSGSRQLSSLAATSLQSAASNNDYIYGATANDNYAAGSGHGPSSHGGGGGGGGMFKSDKIRWEMGKFKTEKTWKYSLRTKFPRKDSFLKIHGPPKKIETFEDLFGKDGCNSALGLLGVLGLASYLQNVLRQMTTTTVRIVIPPVGRKKRHADVNDEKDILASNKSKTQSLEPNIDDLTNKIVPLLTAVGHARDGLIPVRCTRRQVCLVNQLLTKELEAQGKAIGVVLSTSIGKMLKEVDKTGGVVNEVAKAAKAGRKGENCVHLYPSCPALSRLPIYTIPSSMDF